MKDQNNNKYIQSSILWLLIAVTYLPGTTLQSLIDI